MIHKVVIVIGPDSYTEGYAIRGVLEYLGCDVRVILIGRPSDLIKIFNGQNIDDTDHLIFSFHGLRNKMVLPKLGKDVYTIDEPKNNFGRAEILKYGNFKNNLIINTACTLGKKLVATAFNEKGCPNYIAPNSYVEANSALIFVLNFYYQLIQNSKTIEESYKYAASTDSETSSFKLFRFDSV